MNHIAKKIEGLALHGDEVIIHVGPDMVPVTFMRCGTSLWIGDCQTPGCRGLIETDSSEYASAICDACEARLDSEAVEAPPALKVQSHRPAPRPAYSLTVSSGRLPLPKLQITRPTFTPTPTPQCRICQRFMAPGLDGQTFRTCGTCRGEKHVHVERHCATAGCPSDMSSAHPHKVYCNSCSIARAKTGQRRQTKQSIAAKERRLRERNQQGDQ